jgi:hypothetical protein
MNTQSQTHLRKELRSAGADEAEADELLALASNLKHLKGRQLTYSPVAARQRLRTLLPFGLTSLSGIALGMALVIFSQTVLPGSWLYPVQALSDNVAASVDSGYSGTVMMKRAEQVKQLIAAHASSKVVLATLADYKNEAAQYTSVSTHYAAFEYCKTSLQQAAAIAPSPERQAIISTLDSLSTV